MKKTFLLFFIFSIFSFLIYSQPADKVTETSLTTNTQGVLDAQCVGGIVYDDNIFENGYGWGPNYGIGKWVMLMTPTSYPFTINQVCLALTRYPTATDTFTFDIEVYDTTGTNGSPGNLLASIPNQKVTNLPVWPQVSWFDFTNLTGIPAITSGSVYVGISFDPQPVGNRAKYIGADESPTTTLRLGWGYIQNAYPWTPIQIIFSLYKAIGIRCEGTGTTYAHNFGAGPFLNLPSIFNVGTQKLVKAKITNFGTTNETGVPIKFFVNGAQVSFIYMNLNAGQVDSVSFSWTPTDTGTKNIRIISALSNDQFRANDTVQANVHVLPAGTLQVCVGTTTTAASYPFYTFYMDARTDMLYTAAELGTTTSGLSINKIGFTVLYAAPEVMNGFKIKMQNSTLTSLSGFTSSGWTEVFSSNYSIPGAGLQWIQLSSPFELTTGSNLLVEICFNNSNYTSSSTVTSTSNSGRTYHAHQDLPSGDGCVDITSGTMQANLPNMCILGTVVVGTENQHNGVPKEFALSQNYPNPFNPSTIINYQLPKSSYVKLTIFDVIGRELNVLVDEKQNAGTYEVKWDAANYPSGVYFYTIQAGDFKQTKKMSLIK